jgi:phage terminase large subunit-like protein
MGVTRGRPAGKGRPKPGTHNPKGSGRKRKTKLGRAELVIEFLEGLPITKGILQGKPMRLLDGQKAFIRNVYGDGDRGKDPRPRRLGIKSEAKGNGKTGLLAGLALCHLLGPESEPRGEIYSAAMDRQQAAILFAEMEAIIFARPDFNDRVNIKRFHKQMEVLKGEGQGSTYEALSADARRAHGLAPSLWVYDELAQAKTRELLDNLMQGMSKRKEALGMIISTQAPDDDHPLSILIDDGLTGSDPSIHVDLLAAPMDADIFDPEVWKSVNPAWGKFLDPADFTSQAERARRIPAFEPAFRNLRLNQRVSGAEEERLCRVETWKMGNVPVNLEQFKGRECFGGLDLSGRHDLTAFVLVFPDGKSPVGYDIVSFFWTPQDELKNRLQSERERFDLWIKQGYIEAIPGPIIRYDWVARRLAELGRKYKIKSIYYDRWRFDDLKFELADLGSSLPLEPFGGGQSDKKVMAPAIEFFAECALSGCLRHGNNPVLTASVLNAIVIPDKAGNPMIDKSRRKSGPVRIDGAIALLFALSAAHKQQGGPSFQMLFV